MAKFKCVKCEEDLETGDAEMVINTDSITEFRVDCECGETYSAWFSSDDFNHNG